MFGPSKKIVSNGEFDDLMSDLHSQGFTKSEREEVEKIFRGDLHESSTSERGIDSVEIENALKWIRANMSNHDIPTKKVDILEEALKDYL